jgi:dTDP-4-amino-4,6-dideoxygalactose transaminase
MPTTLSPVPFIDLQAQRRRIGPRMEQALARVLAHGAFIMGPEVAELEKRMAAFCRVKHALSCSSGTDALILALMAKGIGRGDAVICPSFTFAATAEVVALLGATPVFADILPDTFNLDPAGIGPAVAAAQSAGLRPRAAIVVDLFGQPADYARLQPALESHRLIVLADGAQSFGAAFQGRRVGSIGEIACTSFFPAKPLGCYGDGGAVFTDDDALAAAMVSLRVHGQGADKYDNVRIGINGRLDTLQAAVLLEKLAIFEDEIALRQRVAARYNELLAGHAIVPAVMPGATSVWAQYTLRFKPGRRDAVAAALKAEGIPTAIYYPKPLHQQTAYRHFPVAGGELPVSDRLAGEVLSLPMHPYLDEATQDRIVAAVKRAA